MIVSPGSGRITDGTVLIAGAARSAAGAGIWNKEIGHNTAVVLSECCAVCYGSHYNLAAADMTYDLKAS